MIGRGHKRSVVPISTWQKVTEESPIRCSVAANSAAIMLSFMVGTRPGDSGWAVCDQPHKDNGIVCACIVHFGRP